MGTLQRYRLAAIGDRLEFDGQVVALLVDGGKQTTNMGLFLDFVGENDTIKVGADDDTCECKHDRECKHYRAEVGHAPAYDEALDDIGRAAKEYATGGLLRLADLAIVLRKLKDDK